LTENQEGRRFWPQIWANPVEGLGFVALLIFLVGTVNVFSASFVLGGQLLQDSYFFLKRHLIASGIGIAGLAMIVRVGYRWFLKWDSLWIITVVLLLTAVYFFGADANGARRWLPLIGGIKFQPSELAKLVAVMAASAYIGPRIGRRTVSVFSYPILAVVTMFLLVYFQPDLGTALIIAAMGLLPYFLAGLPRWQVLMLSLLGSAGLAWAIIRTSYRAERVFAWLNPAAYSQTSGYQPIQSLLAIGSGGITGTGLGMGASKFYYLPEAHTDFAFAIWAQETGLIGCLAVLILLIALTVYGIRIAARATDGRGKIFALGLVTLIVGQAIGNVAMVVGLLPVSGVPMPFISYGGSALMVNIWTIGFLISVGMTSRRKPTDDELSEEMDVQSRVSLRDRLRRQAE